VHCIEIQPPSCKKIFQKQALGRGVGMQGEINPLNVDFEIPLELFNTPGTEIAPRSNEVCEYFQYDRYFHHTFSIAVLS
jgi:hypothetical protein